MTQETHEGSAEHGWYPDPGGRCSKFHPGVANAREGRVEGTPTWKRAIRPTDGEGGWGLPRQSCTLFTTRQFA